MWGTAVVPTIQSTQRRLRDRCSAGTNRLRLGLDRPALGRCGGAAAAPGAPPGRPPAGRPTTATGTPTTATRAPPAASSGATRPPSSEPAAPVPARTPAAAAGRARSPPPARRPRRASAAAAGRSPPRRRAGRARPSRPNGGSAPARRSGAGAAPAARRSAAADVSRFPSPGSAPSPRRSSCPLSPRPGPAAGRRRPGPLTWARVRASSWETAASRVPTTTPATAVASGSSGASEMIAACSRPTARSAALVCFRSPASREACVERRAGPLPQLGADSRLVESPAQRADEPGVVVQHHVGGGGAPPQRTQRQGQPQTGRRQPRMHPHHRIVAPHRTGARPPGSARSLRPTAPDRLPRVGALPYAPDS